MYSSHVRKDAQRDLATMGNPHEHLHLLRATRTNNSETFGKAYNERLQQSFAVSGGARCADVLGVSLSGRCSDMAVLQRRNIGNTAATQR